MMSSELVAHMKKVPCVDKHFIGVFPLDMIPKNIPIRSCLIFNMDTSSETGSHWVSLVRPEKNVVEIMDSLGTRFELIKPFLKFPKSTEYQYNTSAFQLSSSSTCGLFCIYFLIERCLNFDFEFNELLPDLFETDLEINEKKVKSFVQEQ